MSKVVQHVKVKNDNHHKETKKKNDVFQQSEKIVIFTL